MLSPVPALVSLLAGIALTGVPGSAYAASPAAPLPRVPIVAQGVSSANPAHLFRSQEWDFARMRQAFNSVSVMPGDQATVEAARRAGLTEAYMRAPMREGADGMALWAWHQLYNGDVYTFLNKNGSSNELWDHMTVAAKDLRAAARESSSPPIGLPRTSSPPDEGRSWLLSWPRAVMAAAAAALLALLAGLGRRRLQRMRHRR